MCLPLEPSLVQMQRAIGTFGCAGIVGDHDDGFAKLLVECSQQVQYLVA